MVLRGSDRFLRMLLGLLIAMCVVLGLVLTTDEAAPSHGFSHQVYAQSMQQGGPGDERHASVRWLGLAWGLLQVAFLVGCLSLGIRASPGRVRTFVILGFLYGLAFALMVIFDHFYALGEDRTIVLGFPLPTTVMLYGVGGAPLAFVLLYVARFDRWILTPADVARFERLVQEKHSREESDT